MFGSPVPSDCVGSLRAGWLRAQFTRLSALRRCLEAATITHILYTPITLTMFLYMVLHLRKQLEDSKDKYTIL